MTIVTYNIQQSKDGVVVVVYKLTDKGKMCCPDQDHYKNSLDFVNWIQCEIYKQKDYSFTLLAKSKKIEKKKEKKERKKEKERTKHRVR